MRRARAVNPNQPVVGPAEAASILGWDARRVAVYARRGVLPAPLAWLAMGPVWRREDLLRWMAERGMATAAQAWKAVPRGREPSSPPGGAPAKPVRFVSQYRGLTLFGAPGVGSVRFVAGVFETADPVLVEWLRRHPGYGIDFREAPAE